MTQEGGCAVAREGGHQSILWEHLNCWLWRMWFLWLSLSWSQAMVEHRHSSSPFLGWALAIVWPVGDLGWHSLGGSVAWSHTFAVLLWEWVRGSGEDAARTRSVITCLIANHFWLVLSWLWFRCFPLRSYASDASLVPGWVSSEK